MSEKEKKRKKFFSHKLKLRNIVPADLPQMLELCAKVHSNSREFSEEDFLKQIKTFPEGQFCIEDNGEILLYISRNPSHFFFSVIESP